MTAAVFWNKLARRYAARPVADIPAYEATLDHVRRYLAPNQNVIEAEACTVPDPLFLDVFVVLQRDLVGRRVSGVRGIAAQVFPLSAAGARTGFDHGGRRAGAFGRRRVRRTAATGSDHERRRCDESQSARIGRQERCSIHDFPQICIAADACRRGGKPLKPRCPLKSDAKSAPPDLPGGHTSAGMCPKCSENAAVLESKIGIC